MDYRANPVQIDQSWLKESTQEAVLDQDGNPVCVCGKNNKMAALIAKLLNEYYAAGHEAVTKKQHTT